MSNHKSMNSQTPDYSKSHNSSNYGTAADKTDLGPWIAWAMVVYFVIAGIILGIII